MFLVFLHTYHIELIMTTDPLPPNTEKSPNNEKISKNEFSNVSVMTDQSNTYDRRVAHAKTIKVVNNRFYPPSH